MLEQLRGRGENLPILILSARDELSDKVAGLERGADDYVTKPFKFEELLARIRVRLRDSERDEETHLEAHRVSLDLRTRRATVDDRAVELSAREFTMLETFLRHTGQVLSRDQLLTHVWLRAGLRHQAGGGLIGYLRRKLGEGVIETVRGVGYVVR